MEEEKGSGEGRGEDEGGWGVKMEEGICRTREENWEDGGEGERMMKDGG